jgi:hypothetical protein
MMLLTQHNFNANYPHIHSETPPLTDGHQTVIGVYLVPTQHFSRYYAQVTPGGMHAIFGMQIPRIFADVFSRVLTELDPSEPDFAAILSAMRHSTNVIALEHENFDNILPLGQIDPLPFACMQGPITTDVLQLGDDCLYEQLASNPNSNPEGLRQSLSTVCVEYLQLR